jgi:uncharacterized protein
VADIYYRRTLWLIAFGLVHAYFIWGGDILFDYGVTGLFLFPLRKARPSALIAAGVVLLAIGSLKAGMESSQLREAVRKGAEADRVAAAGRPLSAEQREAQKQRDEELKDLQPDPEKVAKTVAAHRGGYVAMFLHRAEDVARNQSQAYYHWSFFDVGGMMLVGMGLMRLGVLSGRKGPKFYLAMMALGYGLGIPLNAWTGWRVFSSGFDLFVATGMGVWYSPGRLLVTLGHVGLIVWLLGIGFAPRLMAALAAVGRMALTNYLGTSVVCTLVFNGYGLGLYDRLARHQLLAVVVAVWAANLILSPLWLRAFRYGPVEWLWRSLTYGRLQPIRAARA